MDKKTKEQCITIGGVSCLSLIGGVYTGHWQNIALAIAGALVVALILYLNRRELLKKNDEEQAGANTQAE